eukprot:m.20954 g.20954  ORF g.20954 m.20954 type:complete len:280 (-) comp11075_c0_seq1:39-878(-)
MAANQPAVRSQIPRTRQSSDGRKKPYIYEIQLILESKTWTVELRYSALYALHKEIKETVRVDVNFPPKKVVNNKDPKFIEARRRELEAWLDAVLSVPEVLLLGCVHRKLEFPKDCIALLRHEKGAKLSKQPSKSSHASAGSFAWIDSSSRTSRSEDADVHSRDELVPDTVSAGLAQALQSSDYTMVEDLATLLPDTEQSDVPNMDVILLAAKPSRAKGVQLKALADYTAGCDRDLGFAKGDVITIVEQDRDTGWWVGTKDQILFGLVPVNLLSSFESST